MVLPRVQLIEPQAWIVLLLLVAFQKVHCTTFKLELQLKYAMRATISNFKNLYFVLVNFLA